MQMCAAHKRHLLCRYSMFDVCVRYISLTLSSTLLTNDSSIERKINTTKIVPTMVKLTDHKFVFIDGGAGDLNSSQFQFH